MPRSPGEGFRTGASPRAIAGAVLLLVAVAAASLFPTNPSFSTSHDNSAASHDNSAVSHTNSPPGTVSRVDAGISNFSSDSQVILTMSLLVFAIVFMITIMIGFRNHIPEKSSEIERIGIVMILVVGALYLITGGFSVSNSAPAFGLFGTIAGYLLGQIRPWKYRSDRVREVKKTDGQDV